MSKQPSHSSSSDVTTPLAILPGRRRHGGAGGEPSPGVPVRCRDVVECAEEGIWILDAEANTAYVNRKMAEMLGYTAAEMLGRSLFAFMDESGARFAREALGRREEGVREQHDFRFRCKGGGDLWTLVNATPLFDDQGHYAGALGMVTDISARKRAEDELAELHHRLAEKNAELQSLIFITSHDLSSPLVNVRGFARELRAGCEELVQVVAEAVLPDDLRSRIETILTSYIPESLKFIDAGVVKMDALLDGLVRLSRLGSQAIQLERLDMDSLMAEVVTNAAYTVQEIGAEITVGRLPACLGDSLQVHQIFSNLLDNALKYRSPSRRPVIRISGCDTGERAIYCVEDNGLGIALRHQQQVFDVFRRLHPEIPAAGEGLGLAAVRRMLDRLDGSIWVESEEGQGSRFYVGLPGVPAATAERGAAVDPR